MRALRERQEWTFFSVLTRANESLAFAWWILIVLRGALPAVFAISMGVLVSAVEHKTALTEPLTLVGVVFVLLQILTPIQTALSANLGDKTAAWLYDRLTFACLNPPGLGHLEDAYLTSDLTMARDFDLGITAPPLSVSMDFIATGLVQMVAGFALAIVLAAYSWWAALILTAAWLSTHWLLRESAVWRDRNTDEVRRAQRYSDYTYRLAVDPPPAKEMRLFGLADWTLDRFLSYRRRLFQLQYEATRLREQPLVWSIVIVLGANVLVLALLGHDAVAGRLSLGQAVVYAQAASGMTLIAFGGLNWALDGSAAPVAAVLRLAPKMAERGALPPGSQSAQGLPAGEIRFRDVTFGYDNSVSPVLENFNLTVPAGCSLAIVGQNGAGKTTLAKLLCRLYDPISGSIEIDGIDLRDLNLESWRSRIGAVFQDFIRLELSVRENVSPTGSTEAVVRESLIEAGAGQLGGELDLPLGRGYAGGIDLSGGQWQRIALARALAAVKEGAGIVLLDEPTAQLDVKGEAEIFERMLQATKICTTILISHRFSTVRKADLICVLEHGRVIELGTHTELMNLNGRYRTMFDLQARRFALDESEEEEMGIALEQLT